LDRIAEKTSADWIYNWIREPKNWSHVARMPSLRLTPEEAANLTAFLVTHGKKPDEDAKLRTALQDPANIKAGFGVINNYGCYACHNIKGFENLSKPSVELTNFARKDKSELAFGDAKIPETWEAWTNGKLKDPQMFLDERSTSFMPKPNISDEERHALVVFLKGQRPEKLPDRYIAYDPDIEGGRRLVNRYNCQACHVIEGEGQDVAKWITEPNFLPPNLATAGARLQTDWLFGFLKNPGNFEKVRSWLDIRMPTFSFSDEETQALVKYFKKLDKVEDVLEQRPHVEITPEELTAALRLTGPENFNCYSCHLGGPQTPAGGPPVWAPAFQQAFSRLRPQWINKWVRNPSELIPGTRMPGYYPEPGTGPKDILEGQDEKQIQALVNYVMTRGAPGQVIASPEKFPEASDTMTPGKNVPEPPPPLPAGN
jgi:cytochrome c2